MGGIAWFAGRSQVMFAMTPLNLGLKVQSMHFTFPISVVEGKEDLETLTAALENIIPDLVALQHGGKLDIKDKHGVETAHGSEFFFSADMSSLWKISGSSGAMQTRTTCMVFTDIHARPMTGPS